MVRGSARVTRDHHVFEMDTNQTTYIPIGAKHRLENPRREMLELIEVQSGVYLGEDDIVRDEDVYGQAQNSVASHSSSEPSLTPSNRYVDR